MRELHVDNETYDTRPSAVVLTVGCVLVEGDKIIEEICFGVDVAEQLAKGRTISASTLQWWMGQGEAARKALFDDIRIMSIDEGRKIMKYAGVRVERVWSRPGMFDLPMLRSLFGQDIWDDMDEKRFGRGYQKEADMQGLVLELDPRRELSGTFEGTPHNALDDAKHHHKWLQRIRARQALYEKAYRDANPGWEGLLS